MVAVILVRGSVADDAAMSIVSRNVLVEVLELFRVNDDDLSAGSAHSG